MLHHEMSASSKSMHLPQTIVGSGLQGSSQEVPPYYLRWLDYWNANTGPDAFTQWAGTVARYSYWYTNERGWRVLEFANNHKRTLTNTLYPHKESRIITYSLDGTTHNQIYYVSSQVSTERGQECFQLQPSAVTTKWLSSTWGWDCENLEELPPLIQLRQTKGPWGR